MKKIYIIPTLNVVEIQPTRILDGSETIPMQGNYDSENVTIGARRSRFSKWEDDFDFEE